MAAAGLAGPLFGLETGDLAGVFLADTGVVAAVATALAPAGLALLLLGDVPADTGVLRALMTTLLALVPLGLAGGDLKDILAELLAEAGDFPLGDFLPAGLCVLFAVLGVAFLGEGVDSLAALAGDFLSGLARDFLLEEVGWLAKMSGLSS